MMSAEQHGNSKACRAIRLLKVPDTQVLSRIFRFYIFIQCKLAFSI